MLRVAAIHPAVGGFRPHAAAAAVAAAFALQPALAQPVGGHAVHGQATFTGSGSNLVVHTLNGAGTNHSTINWQSFSVPAGSTTQFIQPSVTSTSINRVLGPDPSAIFGTLSSNGRLVLVNPAGITVGAGGVVDAPGFIASTLRMSDADALAGRLLFQGGSGAAVQVDGKILARSGDVVLVGTNVQTGPDALVQADGGALVLAAGNKVALTGRGLEGIQLEVQAGNEARNLGTLQGDAVGVFAHTLRHSGLVAANAVSTEGGKVVLKAIGGDALVDGTVVAKAGDQGGRIDVLGARVALLDGAKLDASGRAGGGQVRVGGDYQGKNPEVPNARRTFVAATATIHADATERGDGGKVIVWGDEVTMHGTITARGGAQGGNGGFVEVSGKQALQFTGTVDRLAPKGRNGTLLLDPNDILIDTDGNVSATETTQGAVFGGGPLLSRIRESDLERALLSGSVIVATNGGTGGSGDITVASGVNVQWSGTNALGLQSDRNINLLGSFNASDPTGSAVLSLHAINGNITQAGTSVIDVPRLQINLDNGSANLTGSNLVSTIGANIGGVTGTLIFQNAKDLTIGNVASPYGRAGIGIDGVDTAGNKASVVVLSAGALNVNSDVSGGTVILEGATVNVGSAVTVSSTNASGIFINAIGNGNNAITGTLVSDGFVDIGGNGTFSLGNIQAPTVLLSGGSPEVPAPTSFTQASGTAITTTSLVASVTNAPGSNVTLANAGNKIDSVQVSASGDVSVSSASNLVVGPVTGNDVKLQAAKGDLNLLGNVTAAKSATLSGGTDVVVKETSTVTAPTVSFVAPLTTVRGKLQPGGAGGIGTVRASGSLAFAGAGTMQLDVASLTSFDQLVAGGTVNTASTTALQVVDQSGGTLVGSFSPVSAASGSAITFAVPANWFVTPITSVSPYIITAGATPAPAPVATATVTGDALQVNDQLVTFAKVFLEEAGRQDEVKRIGKDDIVVTDTACRAQ
jgi:filamentous hemagglutinin family protein